MNDSLIVIDIGNSTLKYAEVRNKSIIDPRRIPNNELDSFEFFESRFSEVFSNVDTVVASIGIEKYRQYMSEMAKKHGFNLVVVSSENTAGVQIMYETPHTLGADRIANTIAVKSLAVYPCIVVDCGTAINIDVIDKTGTFIGGMITAGIETTNRALQYFAPALPDIDLRAPKNILGTDTLSCIQSGILFGAVGMIESSVARFKKLFTIDQVILTGGHAELLHPLLDIETTLDPWLTLKGLSAVEINL